MKKWNYFLLAVFIYLLAIYGIGVVESQSEASNIKGFTDALWYAIVTLTTVGYGDSYPVTPVGKVISLTLVIGSIGVLGYLIGEITNKFNLYMEKKKTGFWGTNFENHYVIIGYNDFGRQVASQIVATGHKLAFLVNSKEKLDLIKDVFHFDNCFAMFADYNNDEAYDKINLTKSKAVFLNFDEDTDTLVYVLNLKKKYPNVDVVVTCKNSELKETFVNAGIKYVVSQTTVASRLVASYIFEPEVASYTEDLITTSRTENDFDMQQYKINTSGMYFQKSFMDIFLGLKKEFNAIAIGIVSHGKVIKNPPSDFVLTENDYVILISNGVSKKHLEKAFGVKEGK
ncbi:potassium channel protein [Neptunitalea chrysea]|uniref:Potassium channel protein n=1 Tax=Neptunitalea chrysea TaxID=1647581 RepID=A0A9W6B5U4_9FLAO|nr:ion channel [Neptunitalea chrysea]GLB53081.1 potassium channel protein [Neptunitalea chrysea]